MATGFLLATCCSDPGIIPRREALKRRAFPCQKQVVIATKTGKQLQEQLGYALSPGSRGLALVVRTCCAPTRYLWMAGAVEAGCHRSSPASRPP